MYLYIKSLLTVLLQLGLALAQDAELRMPGVMPHAADQYMCKSVRLDPTEEHYLVGFTPHGSMDTAHHMLLYGCSLPGSDEEVWNCGEMHAQEDKTYGFGPVCQDGAQIIYAWALDAPALQLPEGVGIRVGGDTRIRYLVLQVHYMHQMPQPDYSGITLHSTEEKMPKSANTVLMVTGGSIAPKSDEKFETACLIEDDIVMHPFAFRTHTHKHGTVVSGWKVEKSEDGKDKWTLIGKKDPMKPQMFYPIADQSLTIQKGDIIAARCSMKNEQDEAVQIGSTGADEMCNFYMMYWVDGEETLDDNTCFSPGPPYYYWGKQGGLNNIPEKEASTL